MSSAVNGWLTAGGKRLAFPYFQSDFTLSIFAGDNHLLSHILQINTLDFPCTFRYFLHYSKASQRSEDGQKDTFGDHHFEDVSRSDLEKVLVLLEIILLLLSPFFLVVHIVFFKIKGVFKHHEE